MFALVFGLQLVEIDTKHDIYILVSNRPGLDGENLKQDNRTAKLGLVTVILSFIYMRGNAAKESDVWEMLKKLRVEPGKRHKVFGNVRELVTVQFVPQKYLEYSRMPNTDLAEFQFQCGLPATKETCKMQILHFVAKIQSKDPTAWTSQYNEAAAAEGLSHHTSAPGDAGGQPGGTQKEAVSLVHFTHRCSTPWRLVNQQPLGAGASAHAEPSVQGFSGTLPLPS
ncbi:non-structural maintenance of chromosomes element 3 homolog [Dermochelys coriacea]|uniref:non-structural maintenance of chromosomes element 3 homolog n=1 Tax=Dermochelys coriacea TaxID=27794 RepID=UPI001CA82906|nr:non-structural maintenance of chromosomes element 3 homolog [Dermochelys coriacea]